MTENQPAFIVEDYHRSDVLMRLHAHLEREESITADEYAAILKDVQTHLHEPGPWEYPN